MVGSYISIEIYNYITSDLYNFERPIKAEKMVNLRDLRKFM
jgi:hypothetical protein